MKKEKIKELKKNFALLLITIILFLFVMEITLRIFPELFGQAAANNILSKYNDRKSGIYIFDLNTRMRLMKPNFETTNYYSGFYWHHKTDSRGFRNEKEYKTADIILLGDSLIYGQGLNYNKTVGFILEKKSGYSVYNLSRQGDCSFDQKFLLNKYAPELKPKYIFYFFNENDLFDLSVYLTKKEMQYFVEKQDLNDFSFKEIRTKKPPKINLLKPLIYNSYFFNSLNTLYNIFIVKTKKIQFKEIKDYNAIEWQYQEKAIKQMKTFSDSINAKFILITLTNKKNQQKKLKQIAEENKITLIETKELTEYNQTSILKKKYSLKKDGHLNEKGHKKLTEILLNYLKKNK